MKTKPITFIISLTFLFFNSCLYPTPYQPTGPTGGYSEKNISEAIFLVMFEGNKFLDKKTITSYLNKRIKEVAKEKECAYFKLISTKLHTTVALGSELHDIEGLVRCINKLDRTDAEILESLAKSGNAQAQYELGVVYDIGIKVLKNFKKASQWYLHSAENGLTNAQYSIGVLYERGEGVTQDYFEAHKWYNIASANGDRDSIILKNQIEKQMTPSQIEEAQRLAKEWIERRRSSQQTQIEESPPQPSTPQPPKSEGGGIATGSGFLFGSQDYIITNYHVVKGTSELKVKFVNEEVIDAKVVAKDTQNDVAILKLNKSPSFQTREMKFGDSSMVRMGDKVFTIGYPSIQIMGFRPKYTEGVISALTGIKDDPTVFQTSVPIQPGNSGGPLFNEKGEVIGLTTASLSLGAIESIGAVPQNVNYTIKSSFVKNVITYFTKNRINLIKTMI